MKTNYRYMVTTLFLVSTSAALADVLNEVQHLLHYVENNGCEFERNGAVYDSREARAHMERKYNYVKSHVDEAEDFIKYAATESSISGKKYYVVCGGKRQASAEWLQDELSRYRNSNSGAAMLD